MCDGRTTPQSSSQNRDTVSFSAASELRMRPRVEGLSEYGSSSAAPHEPRAPAQTLISISVVCCEFLNSLPSVKSFMLFIFSLPSFP